ncbi:uncharacterized protein KY384_008319 [Bacidia gigantensis]|uniref:uncharacterized protein n=1 Tax=Bacidia gigantensis TaxID=2732470 RepID=UPI001D043B1A|nr:uncharacterized protein KY384_008319 [Bacidia gigantensis]KAG8526890.1 hypothetical protein KY384_008319 [Bacidia gigantensis]
MDSLIEDMMQQTPTFMRRILSFEGFHETLASLATEQSKAAYMIRVIAVVFCRLSQVFGAEVQLKLMHEYVKNVPLLTGKQRVSTEPNDIQYHVVRSDHLFHRHPSTFTSHDLRKLEDLYYATCAKLKDFLHQANVLMDNNFKLPDDDLFHFDDPPFSSLRPVTLGSFKSSLLAYQAILSGYALVELLENSIRTARNDSKAKITFESPDTFGCSLEQGARETRSPSRATGQAIGVLEAQPIEPIKDINRDQSRQLSNICNMSSGMIFAQLAEKYRSHVPETEKVPISDLVLKENHAQREAELYVSPYNLEERAKKLFVPGGAEMPCICDPECICAPLCASDPTQNCLCEENGLFVRVTEGMNIDDLDVPDLIRWERQSSEFSRSSASSIISENLTRTCQFPTQAFDMEPAPAISDPFQHRDVTPHKRKQDVDANTVFDVSEVISSNASRYGNLLPTHLKDQSTYDVILAQSATEGMEKKRISFPHPPISSSVQEHVHSSFQGSALRRTSLAKRFFGSSSNTNLFSRKRNKA